MKKYVLITGGTGFIGRALCKKLLEKGHSVTVLSRAPESVARLCGASVRGIASLDEVKGKTSFDAIINLAGAPIAERRWTAGQKELLRSSRIDTTRKIIGLIEEAGKKPEVLISASAVGYYGDGGDEVLDEGGPFNDEFTHRLCRDWEAEAERAEKSGVRVAIVRTGLVAGRGGFLKKMLPPFRLGLGGRIGDGRQWMSWIHMDDLLNLILFLLENDSCKGAFNATAPNPVTNDQFTRTLAKCLNRPAFTPIPAFALKMGLGEMSRLLLTGQRVIPRRAIEKGFSFNFEKLEAALRDVLD